MKDPLVSRKSEKAFPRSGILKHFDDDSSVCEDSLKYHSLASTSTLDSLFLDSSDESKFPQKNQMRFFSVDMSPSGDTARHVRFPDQCPGSQISLEEVCFVPSVKVRMFNASFSRICERECSYSGRTPLTIAACSRWKIDSLQFANSVQGTISKF